MLPVARKQRYTISQLKLKREQRYKNLDSAFVVEDLSGLPR